MYKLSLFVIAAFAAFGFTAQAQQDSCSIILSRDKKTRAPKAETAFIAINKETNNLDLYAFRSASVFSIYFGLEIFGKPICFEPGSRAIVLFADRSQVGLTNDQQPNCDGRFLINAPFANNDFTQKQEIFNALVSKTIRGIRFYTVNGIVDFDVMEDAGSLNAKNAERFKKSLECLKETALQ